MADQADALEPLVEHFPVVRSHQPPAVSDQRLPAFRLPRQLGLSSVVLASGITLAVEGLRLAALARRRRSVATRMESRPEQISVTYQWTHITHERYERS